MIDGFSLNFFKFSLISLISNFWKSGSGKTFTSYIYPHKQVSDDKLISLAANVLTPPLAMPDPNYVNNCEPFSNYGKQPDFMNDVLQKLTSHTANCTYVIDEYQKYPSGKYDSKKYKTR